MDFLLNQIALLKKLRSESNHDPQLQAEMSTQIRALYRKLARLLSSTG